MAAQYQVRGVPTMILFQAESNYGGNQELFQKEIIKTILQKTIKIKGKYHFISRGF